MTETTFDDWLSEHPELDDLRKERIVTGMYAVALRIGLWERRVWRRLRRQK